MKILLSLLVLLSLALPLIASADSVTSENNQEVLAQKTQDMIWSKVFIEKDGIKIMQAVSSNLNNDWKEILYYQNKKSGAWGWLNLLVPTVGSWIAGDKVGGIIGIVGNAVGLTGVVIGEVMYLSTTISSYSRSSYYSSVNYNNSSSTSSTGIVIMLASLGIMIVTDILTVVSAYNYVDDYNVKLKSGLGLISYNNEQLKRMEKQIVFNAPKNTSDSIYLDLISFIF